jgi:golgi-specific brefeldin A-resistance guanine nucleotide exchange factor 1
MDPPDYQNVPQILSTRSPVTIAVDPVALVVTECITVTSAMRKHARWAHSSVSAILGGSSTKETPSLIPEKEGRRLTVTAKESFEDDGLGGRWGLRGKKGKSLVDNPLISAFTRLRSDLKNCKGMVIVSQT